jgi:crotonobetainyl-CoA:carnitine CoA-transferase CaiB-like acyl-CoA transferase
MNEPPLAGVTVLDLSTTVAGAYAGKLLAGYGADVLMVEPPDGSPVRSRPPLIEGHAGAGAAPEGTLFRFLGAGKRSVALDLEETAAQPAIEALARDADVLIDTRQPRELAALPLSYEALRDLNPRLVITSITPFGLSGPYADYRATALQLAAAGGWLTHSGEPRREPLMPNSETLEEFFPGTMGAIAALTGLRAVRDGAGGQLIEVAGIEVLQYATRYYETSYVSTGREFGRSGNSLNDSPTYRVFDATDGHIVATASTSTQIEMLMTLTETIDLGLGTREQRYEGSDELIAGLGAWFRERTRDESFHAAQSWRVPFASVSRISEVARLEQPVERESFDRVEDASGELQPAPGPPVRLHGGTTTLPPAPRIGEHTHEVLSTLGLEGDRSRSY